MNETSFNAKFVNLASKLFKSFTQNATYKHINTGGIDLNTGLAISEVIEVPIYCRRTNPTKGDLTSGLASVEDSIISTAGAYFATPPKMNDKITIQNTTYTVKQIIAVDSVKDVAYYKFICKVG